MKRNKKLLLALGTLATVIAPIATVVSCGSTTPGSSSDNANPGYGDGAKNDQGNKWNLGTHREVTTTLSSPDGKNPWAAKSTELVAPQASLSSTILAEERNATQVGLFRKQKLGYDDFKKETVQGPHGPETKIISSPNRESVLKFELADKVTFKYKTNKVPATAAEKSGAITDIDDTEDVVFDSDSADKTDAKSINGTKFQETLKSGKFVRIQFHISDEAKKHYWIQQLSGEKESTFSANDIWAGMQYTIASTSGKSRFAQGGTTELDSWLNKESGINSDLLTAPDPTAPNAFYVGSEVSLGILADQFKSANKSNVVADDSTFNLNFNGTGDGNQLASFWNVEFKGQGGIKALSADEVEKAIKAVKIPTDAFKDAATATAFENTDAYKSGVYQISNEAFKDHCVGGPYYVSANDPEKFTVSINKDYVNQEYINEENSKGEKTHIKTYTTHFIQESDLVETTMANSFKEGMTVSAGIKGFSQSEMIKAMADQAKYGLHFGAGYTSGATLGDYTTQQLVPFLSQAQVLDKNGNLAPNPNNGKVFYNDNYAKVLWGKTIPELKTDDTYTDVFKTLFDGTGFEFRTAIQSAINAFTAQKEAQTGTQEWTNWFAPEGAIPNHEGGDDFYPAHADSADTKDQDVIKALTSLTSKFTESVDPSGAITSTEHTRQSYVDIYTSDTDKASEKYSAEDVASIKKVMKDALDKAGIPANGKVTWEFSYGRGMTSTELNPVYEELRKAINSLDPRLNLVAKVTPGTENGKVKIAIEQEEITPDFSMDDKADSSIHHWVSRLFAAKQGGNAGSLNIANPYEVPSPASPILSNIGYLQTGVFGGISYFADNENLMTADNHLDGLKPIIKSLSDELAKAKAQWGDIFDALPATEAGASAAITTIKDAMASLDVKHIHESSVADISSFDWFGWKDLKPIAAIKETKEGLDPSSQVHAALDTANDLINNWIKSSLYNLQNWMDDPKTPSIDIMNVMIAYNIIAPWSTNPLDATLGDRENPSTNFRKNWFYVGTDAESFESVDYDRVDLTD